MKSKILRVTLLLVILCLFLLLEGCAANLPRFASSNIDIGVGVCKQMTSQIVPEKNSSKGKPLVSMHIRF